MKSRAIKKTPGEQGEKDCQEKKEAKCTVWGRSWADPPPCAQWEVQQRREQKEAHGLEIFPTFVKGMIVNILKTQQTPNRTNSETSMKTLYDDTV